jgi:signal transduction histidine kinase
MGGARPDVESEWRCWQERMLRAFLWLAVFIATAAGSVTVVVMRSPSLAVVVACTLVLELFAALRRSLPYRVRVVILLGGIYAASTAMAVIGVYGPNALWFMGVHVLQTTLLLGRRWGLAMTALLAAMFALVMIAHLGHALPFEAKGLPDGSALARAVVNFVILAVVAVLSVSYLLDRARQSLEDKVRVLEALERAHAEKVHVGEELFRRDEALRKARELEILGRLAASIAHDFNNLLGIMSANVTLAQRNPALADQALRDIEDAVQQAASTTRQLRAFGPHVSRPPVPLAIAEVITQSARLLERILPADIELHVTTDGAPVVRADEGQIQRIFTNLVLNARDAMPDGGRIDVRVRAAMPEEVEATGLSGAFAAMEVEDRGVGMSPETVERMFEPFFTTKGEKGTGLGLASAKSLVEASGGRIIVASEVGRGTTLTVYWPGD